ncbi:MAG: xanthine dehydrogenase family protein subunit M [Dehalococcoidia bacterium]
MQALKYTRASSIDEAIQLLRDGGPTARVLAGGTDVIVAARERRLDVDLFIDVKHVPETMALTFDAADGLTVGAAVPCYRIYEHEAVREHYPALIDATTVIGGRAIQGRASLGGNLCNSSPAADSIPAMIVLSASANIVGPSGERSVSVAQFCTGPGQNVLEAGEFVVSIHFPPPAPSSGAAWQRFIPRNEMDIAVANAATQLQFDGDAVASARISIGAVAPTPLFVEEAGAALAGGPLTVESIAAAAAAARAAASPIDDMRGSIKQRRHLVGVLTERTIRDSASRAGFALPEAGS